MVWVPQLEYRFVANVVAGTRRAEKDGEMQPGADSAAGGVVFLDAGDVAAGGQGVGVADLDAGAI